MHVADATCRARPGNLSFLSTQVNMLGTHLKDASHQQHCLCPCFALVITNCRVTQHLQEKTAGLQLTVLCLRCVHKHSQNASAANAFDGHWLITIY